MTEVAAGVAIVIAVLTVIVYNARQSAKAESSAAAEEAAREAAAARASALEAQRAKDEATAAQKDADDGDKIVASGSGPGASEWLRTSFPPGRNGTN